MKIRIAAWRSEILEGTGYADGETLTGTEATAVRIAGEIFRAGPDVLLRRSPTGMIVVQCYGSSLSRVTKVATPKSPS